MVLLNFSLNQKDIGIDYASNVLCVLAAWVIEPLRSFYLRVEQFVQLFKQLQLMHSTAQ